MLHNGSQFFDCLLAEESAKVPEKDQELHLSPELPSKSIGPKIQSFDGCLEYVLR